MARCERSWVTKTWPYTKRCAETATAYAHVPTNNPKNPKETETLIVCGTCKDEAKQQGIKTGDMG